MFIEAKVREYKGGPEDRAVVVLTHKGVAYCAFNDHGFIHTIEKLEFVLENGHSVGLQYVEEWEAI